MKKLIAVAALLAISSPVFAGGYFTLGYASLAVPANSDLGLSAGNQPEFNIDGGYLLDNGLNFSFRYDHLDLEDYIKDGKNVRVVSVVPALGVGYAFRWNSRFQWWVNVFPGYAVSTRYRLGTDNYKGQGFALTLSTSGYYHLKGKAYLGVELGWRSLVSGLKIPVSSGLPENPNLDLGGFFAGISIRHIF